MMTRCLSVSGALLLLLSMPVSTAEKVPHAVLPLGIFSSIKTTADHTYGHEVRLWRFGNQVAGRMTYWDGNPEGQRGRIEAGVFDPQSGQIRFGVTVTRRDVQPNITSKASFSGHLARGGLWGELKWEVEAAQGRGQAGVENLNLPMSKSERLESFATLDTWRKAFSD